MTEIIVESEFVSLCTTAPLLYWIFIVCSELSHRETLFSYFSFAEEMALAEVMCLGQTALKRNRYTNGKSHNTNGCRSFSQSALLRTSHAMQYMIINDSVVVQSCMGNGYIYICIWMCMLVVL